MYKKIYIKLLFELFSTPCYILVTPISGSLFADILHPSKVCMAFHGVTTVNHACRHVY